MATNPMGQFLQNFATTMGAVQRSQPDPLREMAMAQDMIRWDQQAPQREANLAATRASTEATELQNQQTRKGMAGQAWAEAELRANELGGLKNALDDPIFKQRTLNAVNIQGEEMGTGYQLADYARINRSNLDQFGISLDEYEDMLSQHNPDHVPGEDDDELIIPLFKSEDGTVGPVDIDEDGHVETWSAQEAMNNIRGMFVGSDEYAAALGSLYTGQPGVGGGSSGGGFEGDPASLMPPEELQPVIQSAAEQYGVPSNVLTAILHQESRFNPNAVNEESGARGIAQYIPETANSLGIDPSNVEESINATAMQLSERLQMGESLEEAIMHHFGGPDRALWGEKTRAYGQEVMGKASTISGLAGSAQPGQSQEQPDVISRDALAAANLVAGGVPRAESQPAQSGQNAQNAQNGQVTFEPAMTTRQMKRQRESVREQLEANPDDAAAQQQLQSLDAAIESEEEFDALWAKYSGDNPDAREAAHAVPPVPGESGETAFGVPRDALPENQTRAARRVSEGKGISPAQAKELALDPSTLPQPTPRATVAAGATFLSDLEETEDGYGYRGGERPSHKQLTTAVILNRAGLIDSDSLTRYADLGVVSTDGVSMIQTGMQQVGQDNRQRMSDASAERRNIVDEQGRLAREMEKQRGQTERKLIEEGADPVTFEETRNQNILAARNTLEAQGMTGDQVEEISTRVGAKATRLATEMQSLQTDDWKNPRVIEALVKAEQFEKFYNEQGWETAFGRWLGRGSSTVNLSENPLAINLMAEGSGIMELPEQPGFFESLARNVTPVNMIFDGMEGPPRFVKTLYEPMVSAAREIGMEGQMTPDHQMAIFDIANEEIRSMEDRSALNNDALIKDVIREVTTEYLEAYRGIQ